jgi:hypothetical protein
MMNIFHRYNFLDDYRIRKKGITKNNCSQQLIGKSPLDF